MQMKFQHRRLLFRHPFDRLATVCVFATVAVAAAVACGQEADTDALPVWTEPNSSERTSLSAAARAARDSVFLVGHPRAQGHGTAFCISKKHRLVATNAHVADLASKFDKLMVVSNGTANAYTVEKIYYHPGLRRYIGNQRYKVGRSMDPKVGDVFTVSPDVAVLRLAAGGDPLPQELPLATVAECDAVFGRPVGMLGFPGHGGGWPALGDVAQATYHDGVISKVTDFQFKSSPPIAERQFLQHTIQNFGGFSGSPLILPSGRVVALNNSGRGVRDRSMFVNLSFSIRVDCLWELLAYHKLDNEVPVPVDAARLNLARFKTEDPTIGPFMKAAEMVREAALLSMAGKINESIKLCNQANRVSKEYAEIYTVRSNNYINWAATNMRNVPRSTMLKMYDWAYRDAQTFQKLAPSDPYGPCLAAAILQFRTAIKYEHNPAAGAPTHREVEALMTRLLKLDRDDVALKAEAYTVRAAARSSLRDDDGALADYNAAIQILPNLAMGYYNRADFYEILGQHHQAAADRRRARELEQAAQQ